MNPIRVVQFGLGPIGQACVKVVLQKPGLELVGGIDIDPQKAGRDIGEICGLDRSLGIAVRGDGAAALADWRPQVVLHTTLSFVDHIEDQLTMIIQAGAHVISSSEELFYPFQRNPGFSQRIDTLAKQHGVAVIGTGVNPGFAMDILPLCLTGVCTEVKKIIVTRVVDSGPRRLPLQKKTGAGLSPQEFEHRLATGNFGHIGLRESALAVMDTLGWPVDEIEESIRPVMAETKMTTNFLTVEPGQVAGLRQVLRVKSGGQERLVLELEISVGAKDPRDSVEILGNPSFSMHIIEGGIFGGTATIAALVNTIPKLITAPPGLRTMMELPVPYAFESAGVKL
ncbi:MAG: dihydrodipicolinate reductase [Chloroflexi bacterium]|nr:dihydrodipicolinate reductase [Chloroflexota bacterium]